MAAKIIDITGRAFGRLRAVRLGEPLAGSRDKTWVCLCDPELGGCGRTTTVRGSRLRQGLVVSCGCFRRSSGIFGKRWRK